jgi:cytochrome c peroxidase
VRRQPAIAAALWRAVTAALASGLLSACGERQAQPDFWLPTEVAAIASLWIGSLPPLPPSPGNPVADDSRAVDLGHRLFFDTRLSANAAIACASCHQPERNFKDGLARSQGIGQTRRRSMSVVGAAYSPWLFWDGRRDSLWAQALEPLEDPAEHGFSRAAVLQLLRDDSGYRSAYEELFGALPELDAANGAALTPEDGHRLSSVFANIGRALEAYQRRLLPGPAPFDDFAEALLAGDHARANTHLTVDQRQGLHLFLGRANCIHCHNGPLFTNNEFHNTGLSAVGSPSADRGRIDGVRLVQADPFNCLGRYSAASPDDCAELRFIKSTGPELVGAFRTASLRNIAVTGPFMHTGQFATLTEVVEHYNRAQGTGPGNDLQPLRLTAGQVGQIVAFLNALSAPLAAPAPLLRAPAPAD